MDRIVFLILIAKMTCSRQEQADENSTCFKTVMKEQITSQYALSVKDNGWWFGNNITQKRLVTKRIPVQVNMCCHGYLNISGICTKIQCPINKFGEQCAEDCPCIQGNYERCDVNGTCVCYSGWTGENCSNKEKNVTTNGQLSSQNIAFFSNGLVFGCSIGGALLFSIIGGCVLFKCKQKPAKSRIDTADQNYDFVDISYEMNELQYEQPSSFQNNGKQNMGTSDLIYANCDK